MMQRTILLLCLWMTPALLAHAQDPKAPPAPPKATTTGDPQVALDVLALLLKPLTKEDLLVEANGWRELLKAKVAEVSQAEIAVKQRSAPGVAAKQSAEKSTGGKEAAKNEAKSEPDATPAAESKDELLASLPKLRDERTAAIDRLNVVLLELEAKGGDPAPLRKYVDAVGGLHVDVTDATSAWSSITGWLSSEQGGVRWAWNLARFAAILVGFAVLASVLSGAARRATLAAPKMSGLLRAFITNSVYRVVMVLGFIVALAALEVNIGPMLAAVGAVGFVAGFALQDTLGNFAAGVMILAYRPFDVGDVVDVAGTSGKVVSMNLVSTHLTKDGKDSIIPNSKIWGGIIAKASTTAEAS